MLGLERETRVELATLCLGIRSTESATVHGGVLTNLS